MAPTNKRRRGDLTRRVSYLADEAGDATTMARSSFGSLTSVCEASSRANKVQRLDDDATSDSSSRTIIIPTTNSCTSLASSNNNDNDNGTIVISTHTCTKNDVESLADSYPQDTVTGMAPQNTLSLTNTLPTPSSSARTITPRSSMIFDDTRSISSSLQGRPDTCLAPPPRRISEKTLAHELSLISEGSSSDSEEEEVSQGTTEKQTPVADNEDETSHTQTKVDAVREPGPSFVSRAIALCGMLVLFFQIINSERVWIYQQPSTGGRMLIDTDMENTVYVQGGGFSGFWFTLGRLHSIPDPMDKTYYCYSAGCLGVVAHFRNFTMDRMYEVALTSQHKWKNGDIDRFAVVEDFLGQLLADSPSFSWGPLLSKLKIITSVKDGYFGLKPSIRTPSNKEELHNMLLQTTWIPFATGADLWLDDHMDGAFSIVDHPKCQHEVGLMFDLEMYAHVVNVNLGKDKVEKFWNAGLAYGL